MPFLISNEVSGSRHTDFGDLQITPRFLISESESFTQSFNLGLPHVDRGRRQRQRHPSVTPAWNFWWNAWGGLVVRGGAGIAIPWDGFSAGARTTADREPRGRLLLHAPRSRALRRLRDVPLANVSQPVDDRGSDHTTLTLTPGFRTHLGANWYLLGGFEVPVTNPDPFDYQVIAGLMKVF